MRGRTAKEKLNRRAFFRAAGAVAGLAGLAAASLSGGSKAKAGTAPAKRTGYRETTHVRTYYKLARF